MLMKKRLSLMLALVICPLTFFLLTLFLLFGFFAYGSWSYNRSFDQKVPFPEGTQIIQKSDTHRGLFRTKGTAVIIAKIPEQHIREYAMELRRLDFASGKSSGMATELLVNVEAARRVIGAPNTLYTYQDEAHAFLEEPFSDWLAVIFDLDSGLLCCLEYDE